ncbi:glycosyl hydrolase [Pedobacter panaciterrae]
MNPNNSLWPQAKGLNDYIARCQSILQSGKPDNELLIYWPIYDVWNNSKGMDMALKVHDVDKWLHPTSFYKLCKQLSKIGYSFDFASDRLLRKTTVNNKLLSTSENGTAYKTLIVPECEMINPETLDKIIRLAYNGAIVIFQQLPKDVPGLSDLEERRKMLKASLSKLTFKNSAPGFKQYVTGKGIIFLGNNIEEILNFNRIKRETLVDSGLEFTRRQIASGKYYYLVNHSSKLIDTTLSLNEKGYVTILDPQTEVIGTATKKENKVRIQISSGQTLF